MYLNYGDLTIRNATAADADQITAWWNDGKIMAHAGFPDGLGTTAEEVTRHIVNDHEDKGIVLMIELQHKLIGDMSYRIADSDTARIGIKICDFSKQEKGYGRILLCMLIKELFARGFHTINLDVDSENKRAQHVYEKIGFQKVSINEHSWIDQLGNDRSFVSYLMHPDDLIDYAK